LSHEISRLQDAKALLQRQSYDLLATIANMAETVDLANVNGWDMESKYLELQQSSEKAINEISTRLDEALLENKRRTEELEHVHATVGGVDPTTTERLSHEISRLQDAKALLQRQCYDLWGTIANMAEEVDLAHENESAMESKYLGLQQSSENAIKEISTRLDEALLENKRLTEELERVHATVGFFDPTMTNADLDRSVSKLAADLDRMECLEGELLTMKRTVEVLEARLGEMAMMHEVMNAEVKLLVDDKRVLLGQLEHSEAYFAKEHEKRIDLEEQVHTLNVKYYMMAEDFEEVKNQKEELMKQIAKRSQ
jgi:chromosome segregation ATPase